MPLLAVEGLTKRYGRVSAVENLSFSLERGEILGLIGPNGAGKTTTMRCILGLARPDKGVIEVMGRRASGGPPPEVASRIGFTPETPQAPGWLSGCELLEYLALMEGYSSLEARMAARRSLGMVGSEDLCDKRLSAMSKGERKRVLIAQALLSERELYVMDEPFTGLDPEWVAEVRGVIVQASRGGAGVLLSSHILKEVEDISHRILVLNRKALYYGSLEGLLRVYSGSRVLVETSDPERASRVLAAAGFKVVSVSGRSVRVEGSDIKEVVEALTREGVAFTGVREESLTLEEAYLRLVRGGEPS